MHASVLRYLDQVARHGSIRKAATATNVASSAINRQVLRLEQELGTKLFLRRRDGMAPTPAGEALLRHVRDTLSGFQRLRGEIGGLHGVIGGEVRLATLDSLLVQFVPEALAALARRHAQLSFTVTARGPTDIADELRNGRADIGMSFVDPSQRDIQVVAQARMPLGVIVTPDHPLARRRRVSLRDCAEYPAVLVHDRIPMMPSIESTFAVTRTTIRGRVVSNSLELMREMLLAGAGIGFFTRLGFAREIARGALVHIPFTEPRLNRLAIGLLVGKNRALSPAAQTVLEDLRERLERLAKAG